MSGDYERNVTDLLGIYQLHLNKRKLKIVLLPEINVQGGFQTLVKPSSVLNIEVGLSVMQSVLVTIELKATI